MQNVAPDVLPAEGRKGVADPRDLKSKEGGCPLRPLFPWHRFASCFTGVFRECVVWGMEDSSLDTDVNAISGFQDPGLHFPALTVAQPDAPPGGFEEVSATVSRDRVRNQAVSPARLALSVDHPPTLFPPGRDSGVAPKN